MTKPARAKVREGEFVVERDTGKLTHAATGTAWQVVADGGEVPQRVTEQDWRDQAEHAANSADMVQVGLAWLPRPVTERRAPGSVPAHHVNAPGVARWQVHVQREGWEALISRWVQAHGQQQAVDMLASLARRAGEAWVYAAMLDRERPR